MKTLKLTIKKKWFDMIIQGEKKEEYREIKPYWMKRIMLCYKLGFSPCKYLICAKNDAMCNNLFTNYDLVEFTNGYGKDKPTATFECEGITIGQGNVKWGAPAEDVFIIQLGKEIRQSVK